jgi:hypothetical protein
MSYAASGSNRRRRTTRLVSYLRIDILCLMTQIKSVTLFREIVVVYPEHHMNTPGGQSTKFLNVTM